MHACMHSGTSFAIFATHGLNSKTLLKNCLWHELYFVAKRIEMVG